MNTILKFDQIILVDDNDTTNFYNEDVINDLKWSAPAKVFNNAEDAMTHIKGLQPTGDDFKVLLLLDIKMPGIDGLEMLEMMEEDELKILDYLYVVMLTSSNLKVDVEKSSRFNFVVGYLEKPLSVEKLINSVNGKF
jgi:CheY-like chemotaxis protein